MLSLENRVHSKLLTAVQTLVTNEDVWGITIPLTKQKAGAPCLPVQEQSAAVLALAERCYRGLPRKPVDAAPAALTLHELRVQQALRAASSSSRQGCDGAVWGLFEALLQSLSHSHSHLPHLPTWVQAQPHIASLPPPSFQLRQCTQRSLLTHHFHPGSLSPRSCVTAFQSLNVLDRTIPWKQRYFTEVPFTAKEALISTCFYKARESWKCCTICTDLERTSPEFTVIIFFPLERAMIQKGTATQESPAPGELLPPLPMLLLPYYPLHSHCDILNRETAVEHVSWTNPLFNQKVPLG